MTSNILIHKTTWADVDNDGKINVLLSDLKGSNINGYYSKNDVRDVEGSNKLDIIYVDIYRKKADDAFFSTIAHEFQHLLNDIACNSFGSKVENNELWLNEMLSMLSSYEYVNEYIDSNMFNHFLGDYSTMEGLFFQKNTFNMEKEYLHIFLFGIYLNNSFTEKKLTTKIYEQYRDGKYGKAALLLVLNINQKKFIETYQKFNLNLYFDGINNSKSVFFNHKINYKENEYNNLYSLRSENNLLFETIIDNEDIVQEYKLNTKWANKMFYSVNTNDVEKLIFKKEALKNNRYYLIELKTNIDIKEVKKQDVKISSNISEIMILAISLDHHVFDNNFRVVEVKNSVKIIGSVFIFIILIVNFTVLSLHIKKIKGRKK